VCANDHVKGFALKLNSGNEATWGRIDDQLTEWMELGAPVIGFKFEANQPMSIIAGDKCRPKFFGARKLSVRPGENRTVTFFW